MKPSRFNLFIKRDRITVCYNSYSDNILVIKNEVYDDFIQDSLLDFCSKHTLVYNSFIDNGFIIPKERDELDLIRMQYKEAIADSQSLQLMVYPTQDCNLKCWYCYENHVKGSRMSEDVYENVIKYIENRIQYTFLKSVNLTFFGGEPLLLFDKIAYPMACRIKTLCEKNNIQFTTFFISNASLIKDGMIDQFKEINAYFQITLDGCKDKHNQVRIAKSGAFTYDRIIHAVQLLSNNLKSTNEEISHVLTLRINYDNDTLRNIKQIFEDIKGFRREAIFIHLERVWQTRGQADAEQVQLLIEAVRMFTREGFKVGIGVFGNKRYSCPAEKLNYAIINYNGMVYKCNGRNLTETTREGVLTKEGEIEWDKDLLSKRLGRTTFENPMCLQCKMLPACMGPCSQKNKEHNWDDLENVCSLQLLDMSLEQYILLKCESEWLLQNQKKEKAL